MGNDGIEREIELTSESKANSVEFEMDGGEAIQLLIPPTVYPPRRDSKLLIEALGRLSSKSGNLVEIGTGSGIVAIAMAKAGWKVHGFDVNPMAVAAARGNAQAAGVSSSVNIEEGCLGEEGWTLPSDAEVIAWNLPYLDPAPKDGPRLGPLEEASLGDEARGGWSKRLLDSMQGEEVSKALFVLLFRTDPASPSTPADWIRAGWSSRTLAKERVGEDTLEVVAFWRSGGGAIAHFLEECESTMDAARDLPESQWMRIRAGIQSGGRGRQGSEWSSQDGDMTATWSLDPSVLRRIPPGLIQTAVGAKIAEHLGFDSKWPNDLLFEGRKAGGILVESSSLDGRVRIGVGLNRNPGEIDKQPTAGWTESIGQSETSEIFAIVDSAISSLFEDHTRLLNPSTRQLQSDSWRALSTALSRGVSGTFHQSPARVIGLEDNGELTIIADGKQQTISDVGGLLISF